MPVVSYIAAAVIGYLLGSIPTGFLVAKARGVDIRTAGSGNIGATNAFRILGRGAGIFVLAADALKGWVAVQVAAPIVAWLIPGPPAEYLGIAAGVAAILGHSYTCWLYFKGGKGVATSAGVLIALVPSALLIVLGLWIILFLITRYVSVGSLAAAFALPMVTWFIYRDGGLTAVAGAMAALVIYKHRRNMQRLIDGTENRIEFRKKRATP